MKYFRLSSLFFILFLLYIVQTPIAAQSDYEPCGERLIRNNDSQQIEKILNAEYIETRNDEILNIPVVFHIVYADDKVNPTDHDLFLSLELLNRDFSANNDDLDRVPDNFSNIVGKPNIQFCLAKKAPDGSPTNGIIRKKVDRYTDFYETNDGRIMLFYDETGGSSTWNPEKYLNIYITSLEASNVLGFATLPGSRLSRSEDGVCIDYKELQYFKTNSNGRAYLGRSLTHEVGHWLGLLHIWGDKYGCFYDDGITDTPPQDRPYFGCPTNGYSCEHNNAFMNYMDYVNDQCMHFFTVGQVSRMRNILRTHRKAIINNDICNNTTIQEELFQINPNPFNEVIYITSSANDLGEAKLKIYDLTGRLLIEKSIIFGQGLPISTNDLNKGVYIALIESNNDTFTKKIIKY